MEIILGADKLSTVFYTRLKVEKHKLKNLFVNSLPSEHRSRFLERLENGKIKVLEAIPYQYFHCKWLAIENGGEDVKLLVTSANLTTSHLYEANDPNAGKPDDTDSKDLSKKSSDDKSRQDALANSTKDKETKKYDLKKSCKQLSKNQITSIKERHANFQSKYEYMQFDYAEYKVIHKLAFSLNFSDPFENISWKICKKNDFPELLVSHETSNLEGLNEFNELVERGASPESIFDLILQCPNIQRFVVDKD